MYQLIQGNNIILNITKEAKTALLVISAIVLLIFGYNFLKGKNLLSNDKVFYALYENVEGLNSSSKVTINGFVVGHIIDISFANKEGKLKVTFQIENDFQFGKKSVAKIYSTGFIGGKNIAIIPEENPTAFAEGNETLASFVEIDVVSEFSDKLDPIQNKLNVVLDKTAVMITSLNRVLNEENTNNISESLKSLSSTLNNFKKTTASLNTLIADNKSSLSLTIDNFKKSSDNINKFSQEISNAEVSKLIADLNTIVGDFSKVASKLNTTSGTAGKLINDPRVYDNLDRATRQLDLLLQDVKLNPKRYVHFSVFGKKGKEYNKPKDSLK